MRNNEAVATQNATEHGMYYVDFGSGWNVYRVLKRGIPNGAKCVLAFAEDENRMCIGYNVKVRDYDTMLIKRFTKKSNDKDYLHGLVQELRKACEYVCFTTVRFLYGKKFADTLKPISVVKNPYYSCASPMRIYVLKAVEKAYKKYKKARQS